MDWTNGLRYAYDADGRLSTLTDYDDSTLTYAYDAAGNVASMTDYLGNVTEYAYTDREQFLTLTPGFVFEYAGFEILGQYPLWKKPLRIPTRLGSRVAKPFV